MLKYHGGLIEKFVSAIVVVIMALAGLSACTQGSSGTAPTGNQGPIKIGFTLPITGDFSGDGAPSKQGYELWADTVNKHGGLLGRQVQLDMLDDHSDPQQASNDYTKLITIDHVDLVVGPFGFESLPAGKVASRFGYAMVNGTGVYGAYFAAKLHNSFSVSLPSDTYFVSFANYILSLPQSMRPKTVAYATANDDFTQPQVRIARNILEQGGINTSVYTTYPDETTNYTTLAQQVIAAHADMVVLGSVGLPDCVAFIQAFKQQHYNPEALIAATGPDQGDSFTKAIGGVKSAEGIFVPNAGWYPELNSYQNAQFIQDYIAKYGGNAGSISSDTVQAYSVGQVLEQAVNKIHSIDNAKLIQELHNDTFQSLQGTLKFDDIGRNTIGVAYLFQWQNGNLIPVYPSSQAKANPEFPKPNWP